MLTKIDELIKNSMKEGTATRTRVLRSIKTELTNAEKSGKAVDQVAILNKMKKQREEAEVIYRDGGRNDLATEERTEVSIISEFLPKQSTEKEIYEALYLICQEKGYINTEKVDAGSDEYINVRSMSIPQSSMGSVIKEVKSKLSNVDGKQLSEIVKQHIQK